MASGATGHRLVKEEMGCLFTRTDGEPSFMNCYSELLSSIVLLLPGLLPLMNSCQQTKCGNLKRLVQCPGFSADGPKIQRSIITKQVYFSTIGNCRNRSCQTTGDSMSIAAFYYRKNCTWYKVCGKESTAEVQNNRLLSPVRGYLLAKRIEILLFGGAAVLNHQHFL